MKKIEFETFRDFGNYEVSNMTSKEPSCQNGNVRIVKYKVTIELIEEPFEVIAERLQKLWDECDNWHHVSSLTSYAKKIGYELKGSSGSKRLKK
jgi:hypothetical protein